MSIPAREIQDGQLFRELEGEETLTAFGQVAGELLARVTRHEDGRWLGWNDLRGEKEGVRKIGLDTQVTTVS